MLVCQERIPHTYKYNSKYINNISSCLLRVLIDLSAPSILAFF